MKKITLYSIIAVSILFSACVKDITEEGVAPNFIPHYNYGGYTYYVHPSLGAMRWNDGKNACDNLDAYGYQDWFMPSRGEIDACRGLFGSGVWSSSMDGSHYPYYSTGASSWHWDYTSNEHIVIPVRKQATLSGK